MTDRIEQLLSDYWDAAYSEGCDGRIHDTDNGYVWIKEPLYTSAPSIPEGYVLVPVEPTDDMQEAGCDVDCPQDGAPTPYSVYKAMLAAAPRIEMRYSVLLAALLGLIIRDRR